MINISCLVSLLLIHQRQENLLHQRFATLGITFAGAATVALAVELEEGNVLRAVDQFDDQLATGAGPGFVGLPDVDVALGAGVILQAAVADATRTESPLCFAGQLFSVRSEKPIARRIGIVGEVVFFQILEQFFAAQIAIPIEIEPAKRIDRLGFRHLDAK